MALIPGIIPQAVALSIVGSLSTARDNTYVFKVIARDVDGAIVNMTDAVSAGMTINNSSMNIASPIGITPTMTVHDETGLVVTIAASDLESTFQALGTSTNKYSLTVTDAGSTYVVAQGNLQLTYVP